jgi:hypothetical protein
LFNTNNNLLKLQLGKYNINIDNHIINTNEIMIMAKNLKNLNFLSLSKFVINLGKCDLINSHIYYLAKLIFL